MKLKEFLQETGMSTYRLAKECNVAQSVAHRWATGKTRPDWSNIPIITRVTGGKVTAMDFVPEDA